MTSKPSTRNDYLPRETHNGEYTGDSPEWQLQVNITNKIGGINGDIWLSRDGRSVKWCIEDQCLRQFTYNQKIIKAGYIDFEKTPDCFVVVLSDIAHVYMLKNGGSTTVCFPFQIGNAFWYANGVILERETSASFMDGGYDLKPIEFDLKHKYITLTDPMAPFGLISITNTFKGGINSASGNKTDILQDFQLVLFPSDKDKCIAVFLDRNSKVLRFYYSRILSSDQSRKGELTISSTKKTGLDAAGNSQKSGGISKDLRKFSHLTRRSTSINSNSHDFNAAERVLSGNVGNASGRTDIFALPSSCSRRSLSATLDRMGNNIAPTNRATPSGFFDSSSANTATHSNITPVSQPMQQQQQEYLNQTATSSKDIVLTEISSLKLPDDIIFTSRRLSSILSKLKFLSLRFERREGLLIFHEPTHFCKIWLIDLLPDVLDSIPFKIYGNSPQNMIRLENLKLKEPSRIQAMYIHELLESCLILVSEGQNKEEYKACLYDPFVKITSPSKNISEELTKQNSLPSLQKLFPYPETSFTKLCFEAVKYITSPAFNISFIFLWQSAYSMLLSRANDVVGGLKMEHDAFSLVLSLLILPIPSSSAQEYQEYKEIYERDLFQHLKQDSEITSSVLPRIVIGLHLIREEYSLNVLCRNEHALLGQFLRFATAAMGWPDLWQSYYVPKMDSESKTFLHPGEQNSTFFHPLDEPPSITKSLYSITENSSIPLCPFISFSRLVATDTQVELRITPRSFKILGLYELVHSPNFLPDYVLGILSSFKVDKDELQTYPLGILVPLQNILKILEDKLSEVRDNLELLDRADLQRCSAIINSIRSDSKEVLKRGQRDSYMLYKVPLAKNRSSLSKKPSDIYSILSEIVKSASQVPLDGSAMRMSNIQDDEDIDEGRSLKLNAGLIFSEDKRFTHVVSLLAYYRPTKTQFFTTKTEYAQTLAQKKYFAKIMALRTCTNGVGWGAVAYATEKPISTQKWVIQPLNLISVFPDDTKITVKAPEDIAHDIVEWGQFHAGVSSGLRISKKATGITGSWIAFNKPKELDAYHGGFLLGLGLNGHLNNLEEWHIYNYLSPRNTHISIGLLLGMSSSMKGSMDSKLIKVISVHLVAFLPSGSSDLNIDLKLQTAGIIGMGMLYLNSRHKRMSDSIFAQLVSLLNVNDEMVADEEYRLAAGISLGLINLGAGQTKLRKWDSSLLGLGDDLPEDVYDSSDVEQNVMYEDLTTKLLEIVTSTYDVENDWIPENSQIGAVIAIMFLFLKSNNFAISNMLKVDLKEILKANINTRPELLMYREWASNMILWEFIGDDLSFIMKDVDIGVKFSELNTDLLPIYYTMAGRILAMGIRFASTGNLKIRNILLSLVDKFLPLYQYPGKQNLDFRLTISVINVLTNVIVVSLSMVMCASGDLEVLRRVKYLHEVVSGPYSDLFQEIPSSKSDVSGVTQVTSNTNTPGNSDRERVDETAASLDDERSSNGSDISDPTAYLEDKKDIDDHYGKFISTNLALGFLFLGSGQYALNTSTLESIAFLSMSVLPTYTTPHPLQELKHFWSMAVEPRCLVIKDISTGDAVNNVPIELVVEEDVEKEEVIREMSTPCLLPDFSKIKSIRVKMHGYFPLEINFTKDYSASDFFSGGTIIYIQRKSESVFENKASFRNVEDIHVALKRKAAESKNYSRLNLKNEQGNTTSSQLVESLGIQDLTMVELDTLLSAGNNTALTDSESYNLGLLCSDKNSGDILDCQLELWYKSFGPHDE
ncbi:BBL_G0044880.mRNA.1.CDS.1 [Saccharomyces cerevisiae]|nr:BBL_G0044880.mRNA.1.CDS.1 [Saccharomyces cerevisiae]CAI7302509.1 BBL_G0044880.mRNA.1.CDS.1 [Saccharomyces cerevisiae]